MSSAPVNEDEPSSHLHHLDRFLRNLGTYGTALVDSDEVRPDTWNGLLVWAIAQGAKSGVVIRCNQVLPGGPWCYCHDNGLSIAAVSDRTAVHRELTALFGSGEDSHRDLHV